jgi:hypothetical protein
MIHTRTNVLISRDTVVRPVGVPVRKNAPRTRPRAPGSDPDGRRASTTDAGGPPAAQTRHKRSRAWSRSQAVRYTETSLNCASLQAISAAHRRASRWQHQLDKLGVTGSSPVSPIPKSAWLRRCLEASLRVGGHVNRPRAISGPDMRGPSGRWRTRMDWTSTSNGSCTCVLAWSGWESESVAEFFFDAGYIHGPWTGIHGPWTGRPKRDARHARDRRGDCDHRMLALRTKRCIRVVVTRWESTPSAGTNIAVSAVAESSAGCRLARRVESVWLGRPVACGEVVSEWSRSAGACLVSLRRPGQIHVA